MDSLAALLPSNPPVAPILLHLPYPRFTLRSAPKSIVDGGDDWAVLERKMQTLGVSRFTIDGEPAAVSCSLA